MNSLKAFIEDCKYYDIKQVEVKNILKYLRKDYSVLDIGAGVGRLSFPLSKYAKEIIALDNNKELIAYFKKHKRKNVRFICMNVEDYLKKQNQFNMYILAWPVIDFKLINLKQKIFCIKEDVNLRNNIFYLCILFQSSNYLILYINNQSYFYETIL